MTSNASSNVVGVHYRVGKKIGEGSFGVLFEGTNMLNNQQIAIKFVSLLALMSASVSLFNRLTGYRIGTSKVRCTTIER